MVYVFYISGGLVYWSALLTGVHLVAHIRSAAAQLEWLAPPVKGGTQRRAWTTIELVFGWALTPT